MSKQWECIECKTPIDYEPEYCCSGYMCGCMGMPIDPPLCVRCFERIINGRVKNTYKTTVSTKGNTVYTFWNRKTPYEKEMERLSNMCHNYYLNMKARG